MLIKSCKGYELEKEQSNTSEDFFNRSEVTFEEDGQVKTLHVLYVRYFDELFQEFTPFKQDPVYQNNVYFKDIVALVCLIKNPGLRRRKRLYISSKKEFAGYFKDIDFVKLEEIFDSIKHNKDYSLESLLGFVVNAN